jgi:hypothetical protein
MIVVAGQQIKVDGGGWVGGLAANPDLVGYSS